LRGLRSSTSRESGRRDWMKMWVDISDSKRDGRPTGWWLFPLEEWRIEDEGGCNFEDDFKYTYTLAI